jgi:hypothetical protein
VLPYYVLLGAIAVALFVFIYPALRRGWPS